MPAGRLRRGLNSFTSSALRLLSKQTESRPKYEEGPELGAGTFGVTRLLTKWETRQRFAGKFIPIEQVTEDEEREILNHRLLQHANVIRFVEVYTTAEHLVVVLELASRGELFNYAQQFSPLPEVVARSFFRQLISALEYIHAKHVVHRDLKLENILLHQEGAQGPPILKLCDFGFSKHLLNNSTAHSFKGSPDYIAPEVINAGWSRAGSKYDGVCADVWSSGVILFLLVTGGYPFEAQGNSTIEHNIIQGTFEFPADVPLSGECVDLIQHILRPMPAQRLTIPQIKSHAWFLLGPQAAPSMMSFQTVEAQAEEEVLRVLAEARDMQHSRGWQSSSSSMLGSSGG